MSGSQPAPSKIIPNSYQSPNFLVDDLMRYLSGNEHKCADVVCRKTFGWHKRSDRISKSQIMDMTGLGENAVDECMAELVKYRVVLRISESVANMGVEWSMQTDDALIDLQGLQARDAKRRETNSAKIAKAQEKRKGRYVEHTPHVERPPRGYVQHTPQKTIKTNLVVVVNSGDVAKIYEQEFGAITSMIADTIQDACETYPIDWIPEAMVIAVKNNKRNWKYVEGILKNCKEKNVRPALNKFEPKERIYGNNYAGNRQRAKQPKPANADPAAEYSQADIDTAAEINASVR